MTHNTTECQQRLIALKFLAPFKADGVTSNADGTFGTVSLEAFNHFLANQGKPPIGPKEWTLTRISAALFPEDTPRPAPKASNPITDYLTQLAIKALLANLAKGLSPMLTGYKTYATAAITALMAVYALIFGDLPIVGHIDPGAAILIVLQSLGLGFARTGAKTEAAKNS